MYTAQGHPAHFELGVSPQLRFCRQVPLPAIRDVVVVLHTLFGNAATCPVKQGLLRTTRAHGRTERAVKVSFATGGNGSGGIVRFHANQNADWIAREELPDAGTDGKFAAAEDIPRDAETRSNQVIVAGRQRAIGTDRPTRTWRTRVG